MKTNLVTTLAIIGAAAAALFKLANAELLAGFPAAVAASVIFTVALAGLALAEYGRERPPLKLPRRVVRPGMAGIPVAGQRSRAYGVRRQSAIVERCAA